MWITGDVELPDEILDAHERGELVFFVGAGASLGKPSNLPLFESLARKLARLASHPFSRRSRLQTLLGSWSRSLGIRRPSARPHADFRSEVTIQSATSCGCGPRGNAERSAWSPLQLPDDHLASAARSESIAVPDTWYARRCLSDMTLLGSCTCMVQYGARRRS